ncbi:hypothetical protein E3N88_22150 [Mikania micrantha]|uniref:Uncharacterized protein n=1 Tax=Mikania micrantha TaxID=192012 RepID=A0A5N6NAR5_9ASTR|nr:hypothetical protein E3N88_22150 [Mikania micrantha]
MDQISHWARLFIMGQPIELNPFEGGNAISISSEPIALRLKVRSNGGHRFAINDARLAAHEWFVAWEVSHPSLGSAEGVLGHKVRDQSPQPLAGTPFRSLVLLGRGARDLRVDTKNAQFHQVLS